MKHGDFDINHNLVTYRFYMFNDIRSVILPDGIIIPLPKQDLNALQVVDIWDEKISSNLIDQ